LDPNDALKAVKKQLTLAEAGPNQLEPRISELRAQLRECDPDRLAGRTGASFVSGYDDRSKFHLKLWGREVFITYPAFVGYDAQSKKPLGAFDQALLAYYFAISDGTPHTGHWISFSELPDGRFYAQAFQGYTGQKLAQVFANDDEGFAKACVRQGGRAESQGDRAFWFQVLPHVPIMAVCWLGDEDFPASYRILFDATAGHHLSTDACAIVGSTLCRKLIKAYRTES
jgi:hypothetical protein